MLKRKKSGRRLIIGGALVLLALLASIGLNADLGKVRQVQAKTQLAAEAAAAAAVSKLPEETLAQQRALERLAENDYDCQLASTDADFSCTAADVRVELNGAHAYGPAASSASSVISIDSLDSQASAASGSIRVSVRENVPLFFGLIDIPVSASATVEKLNNLDLVLVLDKSGSMEFDTLCYGCWSPVAGQEYPDGQRWPLPWDGPADGLPQHCSGQGNDAPYVYNGDQYILIEAEDYSKLSNPYSRDLTTLGDTYWVLGRNTNIPEGSVPSYMQSGGGAKALGRDAKGAYLAYHPGNTSTGVTCNWTDLTTNFDNGYPYPEYRMCDDRIAGGPQPSPRVDYEFTVPDSDTWYFWLRGQGGHRGGHVFWGLSGPGYNYTLLDYTDYDRSNDSANGANGNIWKWRRLGGQSLTPGITYTLHLWGGSPGFDADRIIITDNNDNPEYAGSGLRTNILNNTDPDVFDDNRSGEACNPCDARYGGHPEGTGGDSPPLCTADMVPNPYRYLDDIYDDEQPMRASVEAAKRFVRRLDPRFDQIGYVSYSIRASIETELLCTEELGRAGCSTDILENTLITAIDDTHARGSTNLAEGIKLGIDVLSNQSRHLGRPGANKVMIITLDGEANTYTGANDGGCSSTPDLWPGDGQKAKDCLVYHAMQARDNGIVIYSISIGAGADVEIMQYIAELTGGLHYHAPRTAQLDAIYDELYSRLYLGLIE